MCYVVGGNPNWCRIKESTASIRMKKEKNDVLIGAPLKWFGRGLDQLLSTPDISRALHKNSLAFIEPTCKG